MHKLEINIPAHNNTSNRHHTRNAYEYTQDDVHCEVICRRDVEKTRGSRNLIHSTDIRDPDLKVPKHTDGETAMFIANGDLANVIFLVVQSDTTRWSGDPIASQR